MRWIRWRFCRLDLLIDKWRWKVFSGEIKPADYNKGVVGLEARNIRALRRRWPAAKRISIRARSITWPPTCRTRVIFWRQFCSISFIARCAKRRDTRARCIAARFTGTKLRERSLNKMLEMGKSKPWPDALEALAGSAQMDATAILDYLCAAEEVAGRAERRASNGVVIAVSCAIGAVCYK